MLRNLRGVYLHRQAYGKALHNPVAARSEPETYLRLAPAAPDRAEIEQRLHPPRTYQAGLN